MPSPLPARPPGWLEALARVAVSPSIACALVAALDILHGPASADADHGPRLADRRP
jgi:hypothetical protein